MSESRLQKMNGAGDVKRGNWSRPVTTPSVKAGLGPESLLLDENELPQAFFSLAVLTWPSVNFSSGMCEVAPQFACYFGTLLGKTK